MKYAINAKKMEVTEKIGLKIRSKLDKFDKFFKEEPDVKVTLGVLKDKKTVEITIYSAGVIYRAEVAEDDLFYAIDKAADIIERQMRRHKTHLTKKIRKEAFDMPYEGEYLASEPTGDEDEYKIVKVKKFSFKPMSTEEAILQMNLLGHEFFAFTNQETDALAIVYKRKDGNYALIENER